MNVVDGKPVYYWVNQHYRQVPSDAGYVAVVNSTNIIVKDLKLTNTLQGLLFEDVTDSTIKNVTTSNNEFGIWLQHSSYKTITDSVITSNIEGDGIYLFSYSGGNTIGGNIISNNGEGIFLHDHSNGNIIIDNMMSNQARSIYLLDSSDNQIIGNTMTVNAYEGMVIKGYSNNNFIYHENFIRNPRQVSIYDNPSGNTWDNGYPSGGNYWSDYSGVDQKSGPNQDQPGSDGIGDSP